MKVKKCLIVKGARQVGKTYLVKELFAEECYKGNTIISPIIENGAFQIVGSMTTPLAMLFIGIAISKTDWSHFRPDLELFVALAGRYIVCPFIVIALLPFVNLDPLMLY